MKSTIFFILIIQLGLNISLISQEKSGTRNSFSKNRKGGIIIGQIFDASSNSPIEYSNIVLYNISDSSSVGGTVTNEEGKFELSKIKPGQYFIDMRFMGYKTKRIDNLEISRGHQTIDLGKIQLEQSSVLLSGVTVEGERSAIEYKIDKKVINVDKHYTAASGNVVDVLENVPSVSVDIEGNVSLRGSGNFTVLIDNRPTVLDANEALSQIPASTIENIEIITNPSAKFDPDGPSGIINLVMKKQGFGGSSGIVNLNSGLDDKYGGDFLLNYKTGSLTAYVGGDYNRRFMPGSIEEESRTTFASQSSFISSSGSTNRGRISYGFKSGLNFDLDNKSTIGIGFRYGDRTSENTSEKKFKTWNSTDDIVSNYENNSLRERAGYFYGINLDFNHSFSKKGHEISGRAFYRYRDIKEKTTNKLFDTQNNLTSGRIITEDGPADGYRMNIDYKFPFSETNKFELGYQNRLGNSTDITGLADYNLETNEYILQTQYSRDVKYKRYIHSLYSIYSGELGRFGYQGGIRAEYTDREIALTKTNQNFALDRWDYFPTLHFSFKFSDANQFFTSYTKRIVRPRGWNLEPFETWTDAYNLRIGNPDLQPELIDSYEAGYQYYFENNLFSLETYFRKTNNKIEYLRSAYAENVTLQTVANIGNDYSFGVETMFDINLYEWWKINLMGDLFSYEVEGALDDKYFSRKSTNWKTRLNTSFNIGLTTRIQINNTYNSPTVSSQGKREGYFTSSLAIRQEILDNLTATLQFRDLFGTAKNERTSEGQGYYNYSFSKRDAPIVMLNISYYINSYKPNKNEKSNNVDDDDF